MHQITQDQLDSTAEESTGNQPQKEPIRSCFNSGTNSKNDKKERFNKVKKEKDGDSKH